MAGAFSLRPPATGCARAPSTARRRRCPAARTRRPAIGRSPACRCRSTGAIFRTPSSDLSGRADRSAHRSEGGPARHPRRLPRLRAPRSSRSFGEEHIRTGKPICYTSADSVFQIAAHETHFGLERLYRALPDRARAGRSAQHRPRHRPALRRRDARQPSSAPPTAATMPCRRPSRRCSTGWSAAAAR